MIIPNQRIQSSAVYTEKRRITVEPFNRRIRIFFYLFLFSLPFESVLVASGLLPFLWSNSTWSLSRLTGLLLIVGFLLSKKRPLSFHLPSVLGFIFYIFLFLIAAFINYFLNNITITSDLYVILWLILLFVICCEFFLDDSLRNQSLKVLMVAISLCAVLQIGNVAFNRAVPMYYGTTLMRLAAFSGDANATGAQFAVGILIALLFLLDILPGRRRFKLISLIGIAVCLPALIQTGSRGAIICMGISLLVLLLTKKPLRKQIMIWLVSILMICLVVILVINNAGLLSRFQDMLNYGDTSTRNLVYQAAFNLFRASPIIGYGPGNNVVMMSIAMHSRLPIEDTHNVLLGVLTSSGLLGFIPFFIGFVMCFVRAIRARNGPENIAPLMLCGMAITFSQTVSWNENKLFWVLLAYGATAIISKSKVIQRNSRLK